MLSQERLKEIQARVEAATPGIWDIAFDSEENTYEISDPAVKNGILGGFYSRHLSLDQDRANAELAANAGNNLTECLKALDEKDAEIEQLKKQLEVAVKTGELAAMLPAKASITISTYVDDTFCSYCDHPIHDFKDNIFVGKCDVAGCNCKTYQLS